ncbi:MAG: LysM peptidoglycan-binding domain-containing protein [Anaerolineae bacterium]|nr:LysM peptidoglycan-binding domain-containing protein [Anaerolineae bacterium]
MSTRLEWKVMVLTVLALVVVAAALPPAAQAQGAVYVVQPGDNLSSIAVRYGTTVQAIMRANGLGNPNFIYVGQRLTLPGSSGGGGGGGGVHVVQAGETLYSIARRYGTTASAIASANGLRNMNYIYAGQRLTIPGGGGSRGGGAPPSSGAIHIVQAGETLYSIARRYGTTASAIASANGLSNPNYIYAGQRLTIPGGGGGSSGGSSSGGGGQWIDVDLSSQRVQAYAGNTIVRSMVVSTGTSRYPTPPGKFKIYAKYPSVTMSGPGYYLTGVPHTMFFYRGYALHGTYWHNNFGTPMSHGCINLKKADAAWLYNWAPVGTVVSIHW